MRLPLAAASLCAAITGWCFATPPATADEPSKSFVGVGVSFELEVQPILTSRGCNQGACHGKARGQNGFQLSLLGFDPQFDYEALTQQARGRRVFPASPESSLLLKKGTAQAPHGGGRRLSLGDDDYETLLRWIATGAPRRLADEPRLEKIAVSPTERFLRPSEQQPLSVTAFYSDGQTRDVTRRAQFQSSESVVVAVNEAGIATAGPIPGEAAIMTRYMGLIATCQITIPLASGVPATFYEQLPQRNMIDDLVWRKLQSLGMTPSERIGDEKFLRRASLDIIGRIPSPEEVRAFVADASPEKRTRLIDDLLARPEYADHWASKWADLLRPNPYSVGVKAVLNYDAWIRDCFRRNLPYDQFVRELVTAQGSTWRNGAATLYRDRRTPADQATLVSQLFLGVRLECAKCHQHPFEKWGQADFYSFAAYFAKVGHVGGLSPPISGDEEKIFTAAAGSVEHPGTGETMAPRPLFGEARAIRDDEDPREALADWMLAPDNDYFAQVIVNRMWAELMGRGIVDPVDDLRMTNPPSNGPLLKALAAKFREQKFDLKQLIRLIATSYVYELSSQPGEHNVADMRNFSRHYRQRLRAEVLLDAVCDITASPQRFDGMPVGSRANQIWTRRAESIFLDTFGRPDPNQDPPCQRTDDTTVTQVLHLMNSPILHEKITRDGGRAAQLADSERSIDQIVEELYLLVYNRFPSDDERQIGRRLFNKPETPRRQATEDLMWALLNTAEFVFED